MGTRADFDDIWAAYDIDGNGTVDVPETFDTLSRQCPSLQEEKVAIMVSMVTGGATRMSKDELKLLLDIADKCSENPGLEALLTSDNDKSGTISKGELAQVLGLADDQAAQLVAAVDKNGDGVLSIKEILIAF